MKSMKRSTFAVLVLALSLGTTQARAGDCDHVINSNEARTENAITASKIQWETSLDKAKSQVCCQREADPLGPYAGQHRRVHLIRRK